MQWTRATSTQETENLNSKAIKDAEALAYEFQSQGFNIAEYLGLDKTDLSDPKKVRKAVRQKRRSITELDPSIQGEENQKLTDIDRILSIDSAREIFLQEKTFGFLNSGSFYAGNGFDFSYRSKTATDKQKDFLQRVTDARSDDPDTINNLIREWHDTAFNVKRQTTYGAGYNDELVEPQKVGAMICLLTTKLCSAGIIDHFNDDHRTIDYNVITARLCFFEQLLQTRLIDDDDGASGMDGMAGEQFRQHAPTMVRSIIEAHTPGLMPPPDCEGLDTKIIQNPCDKVGRFMMFKNLASLCGWGKARSTDGLFKDLFTKHKVSLVPSSEEEFAVISQYFIRTY